MDWLTRSIMASIALTVLLNVALRWWARRPTRPGPPRDPEPSRPPMSQRWRLSEPTWQSDRVRVWVPWKAMLVASAVLTVVLNLVLLAR